MAAAKEIKEHLNLALSEIGEIKPWFDSSIDEWIFKHPNYPVEYGGESKEEVIKGFPKYLREFIKQRLDDNLNPLTALKTKGHGGKRKGAGRPHGSIAAEPTKRITLPSRLADWLKYPGTIEHIMCLMETYPRNKHFL
jgi:hypothetical protein